MCLPCVHGDFRASESGMAVNLCVSVGWSVMWLAIPLITRWGVRVQTWRGPKHRYSTVEYCQRGPDIKQSSSGHIVVIIARGCKLGSHLQRCVMRCMVLNFRCSIMPGWSRTCSVTWTNQVVKSTQSTNMDSNN